MIVLFIFQTTSLKTAFFPFYLQKKLLKIYFYFRKLYPNVSIEKFLPDSRFRLETTVIDLQKSYFVDLQKSYFAYIFKDEFSFFNPIIFENEFDFRTLTLSRRDDNTEENSFYALSSSNKLFPFEQCSNLKNISVCGSKISKNNKKKNLQNF